MTYFFDSSALVKLYHQELGSSRIETIFCARDRRIIISRLTVVEIQSAFAAKVRTGRLNPGEAAALRIRFLQDVVSGSMSVVSGKDFHYATAERLIVQYGNNKSLRTLDALQIAVALEARQLGGLDALVAADRTVAEIAALEGFSVIDPESQ